MVMRARIKAEKRGAPECKRGLAKSGWDLSPGAMQTVPHSILAWMDSGLVSVGGNQGTGIGEMEDVIASQQCCKTLGQGLQISQGATALLPQCGEEATDQH